MSEKKSFLKKVGLILAGASLGVGAMFATTNSNKNKESNKEPTQTTMQVRANQSGVHSDDAHERWAAVRKQARQRERAERLGRHKRAMRAIENGSVPSTTEVTKSGNTTTVRRVAYRDKRLERAELMQNLATKGVDLSNGKHASGIGTYNITVPSNAQVKQYLEEDALTLIKKDGKDDVYEGEFLTVYYPSGKRAADYQVQGAHINGLVKKYNEDGSLQSLNVQKDNQIIYQEPYQMKTGIKEILQTSAQNRATENTRQKPSVQNTVPQRVRRGKSFDF